MGICFGTTVRDSVNSSNIRPSSTGRLTSCTNSSTITGSTIGSTSQFSVGSESIDDVVPDGRVLPVPNLKVFTFAELKKATSNFKPDTLLGEGGFGKVYKAWVDEEKLTPTKSRFGIMVAVKKLSREGLQGFQEWKSEVDFLGRLSHPNLVKLLGYCFEDRELLLVYEFMSNGSLENHLFRKGNHQPLSWSLRLKIVIGAARGLVFLHISKIIYRDFKAANILLDPNYKAKLSDFGLAKDGPIGEKTHVTTQIRGTYGYAAPEYVSTGHLYVKSDVYGFGVVLLEVICGIRAFDGHRPRGKQNLIDWMRPLLSNRRKFSHLIDQSLDGKYPKKAPLELAQLAFKCLTSSPKQRPSMNEVLTNLEQIASMEENTWEKSASAPTVA